MQKWKKKCTYPTFTYFKHPHITFATSCIVYDECMNDHYFSTRGQFELFSTHTPWKGLVSMQREWNWCIVMCVPNLNLCSLYTIFCRNVIDIIFSYRYIEKTKFCHINNISKYWNTKPVLSTGNCRWKHHFRVCLLHNGVSLQCIVSWIHATDDEITFTNFFF